MAEQPAAASNKQTNEAQGQSGITPALVREVAEKVYLLWLQDLQIERERLGLRSHMPTNRHDSVYGGR